MADTPSGTPDVEALKAEITRLSTANAALTSDLADTHKELKSANAEARDRRHEVRQLTEQLGTATAERDRFKSDAATAPNEWKAKYEEATGRVRGLTHGAAFDRLAKTFGVSEPTKLADLRLLSGFKPSDSDDADEEAIKLSINKALEGRTWLKDSPPPSGDGAGATSGQSAGQQGQTAAGAAQTGPGAQTGAMAGQSGPAPGSDRGQSMSSTQSTPSNRIPGRL
jgi:hypothetical protein